MSIEGYFSSPAVWEALKRKVAGIGGRAGNRRIRLKESEFLSVRCWLPPMDWQGKLRCVATQFAARRESHALAATELDALLPAILDRAFKGEL